MKEKTLWLIFFCNLILIPITTYAPQEYFKLINSWGATITLISISLHSFITLGIRRSVLFAFIAGTIGFISEYIGLNYGVLFGGNYFYADKAISILNIPAIVLAFWAAFIYTVYCLTNSFMIWLGKNKPSQLVKQSLKVLPLLIILDAVFLVIIDLFLDPIKVREGAWTWIGGGSYFGIPIGNFIGWFLVSVISTGLFRLIEYYHPRPRDFDSKIFLIPMFGYGLLIAEFAIFCYKYDFRLLSFFGLAFAIGLVSINSIMFYNQFKTKERYAKN